MRRQLREQFARPFVILRSLLSEPPSPRVWGGICRLFAHWPDDAEKEQAVLYAQEHLESWPASWRVLPADWTVLAVLGQDALHFQLARTCRFDLSSQVPLREALRRLDDVFDRLPQLDGLELAGEFWPAALEALADSPSMPRLQRLRLHCLGEPLEEKAFSDFFRKAPLGALEALDFHAASLPWQRCSPFVFLEASTPHLKELRLHGGGISGEELFTICDPHHDVFSALEKLDLSDNALGVLGAEVIGQMIEWEALQALHLGGCSLEDDGLAYLCHAEGLSQLRSLDLHANALSGAALAMLNQEASLATLREFNLSNNPLDPEGLESFAATGYLDKLTHLYLNNVSDDPASGSTLAALPFANIRELGLINMPFSFSAFRAFCASSAFATLHALSLGWSGMHDTHLRMLARAETLNQLSRLQICAETDITDTGLSALFRAPMASALRELYLSGIELGDGALGALAHSRSLHPEVKYHYLQDNCPAPIPPETRLMLAS